MAPRRKPKAETPAAEPVGALAADGAGPGALTYVVTELAGKRVAGRKVRPGDTIELTETEAVTERLNGAIAPAADKG